VVGALEALGLAGLPDAADVPAAVAAKLVVLVDALPLEGAK